MSTFSPVGINKENIKEYDLQSFEAELKRYQDDKKDMEHAQLLIAVCALLFFGGGMYGTPVLLEQGKYFLLILLAAVGYIFYKQWGVLETYKSLLDANIRETTNYIKECKKHLGKQG